MVKILNLTQHLATPDQISAGVVEPKDKESIIKALTFDSLPSKKDIRKRAILIASIALGEGVGAAMIGGAPYLMSALEKELQQRNITPLYAFSIRDTIEECLPDGTVKKVIVFKHRGFIRV